MTRGGKLPDDIRKYKVNFWITLDEKEMIRRFIKRVRESDLDI